MKCKKCHLIIIFGFLFFIALSSLNFGLNNQFLPYAGNSLYDPPIHINSDSDFISMGLIGSGNSSSPYILSGYIIDVSGFLNDGILIEDTTKYFIIENCTIYTDYIGIRIDNVASGTALIKNNTCISKSYDGGGIGVSGDDVLIINNTCKNFAQGIHANQATNIKMFYNTIENSSSQGINIRYTSNSVIYNNYIKDCREYGIAIVKSTSSSNIVYMNTLDGNTFATDVNIDGINKGSPHSQAYDEGTNNSWFGEFVQLGNCWSDYKGIGTYSIDGPSESKDPYPINCFNAKFIPGFKGFGIFSLSVVIIIVLYIWKKLNTKIQS